MPKRPYSAISSSKARAASKRRRITRAAVYTERIPRDRRLVPPKIMVPMRATYRQAFTSASPQYCDIQVNHAANPFLTYSSNQPRGFDQWGTLYIRCIVHKYKVVVKAVTDAVSGDSFWLASAITAGSGADSGAGYRYTEFNQSAGHIVLAGGANAVRYQVSGSTAKDYGVPEPLDISDFAGETGATTAPSKGLFCRTMCHAMDNSATCAVYAIMQIDMMVEFIEPKPVAAST